METVVAAGDPDFLALVELFFTSSTRCGKLIFLINIVADITNLA